MDFQEFASTPDYPSSLITYYLALSGLLLNQQRWGPPAATVTNPPTCMYDMAQELFVAHHIVLEVTALRASLAGGVPGAVTGPVQAKSTGPISVSYDTGASVGEGDTHWNDTIYGIRFRRLSRMFGAGPIQLGIGCGPSGPWFNGVNLNGPAWPGPIWLCAGPVN